MLLVVESVKMRWRVVQMLTLLSQISHGVLNELWGSFQLQCQVVSLLTHRVNLCLEASDTANVTQTKMIKQ